MFSVLLMAFVLPLMPFAPNSAEGAPTPWVATVLDTVTVETYSSQRLSFAVKFGDVENDYRVMAMFVLPGETVPVSVVNASTAYDLHAAASATRDGDSNRWSWMAPWKPGLYPIVIAERGSNRTMTLNVFVMVPFAAARSGSLNGYPIGRYPRSSSEFYEHPRGFVEVTPELQDVEVSPHLRLGQFVCKEDGGSPQYLVLREPLLAKLEQVLAEVNDRGREAHGFTLLSAYRTPLYNAAIGNETTLSRHHYGDAADIFVDQDGDGRMDDLNHDGRHTLADAHWLGAVVKHVAHESPDYVGGLGTYEPTPAHGAFVHVDVRGFEAHWGV